MQCKWLILFLTLISVQIQAQDYIEYRMEIGAGAGLVSYQGDFNSSILRNMQPIGSIVWRYVLNPRMAVKTTGSYGKIKGKSADVGTYYPELAHEQYKFDNRLGDLSVVFEYNFWPYGTGKDYRGAKRITPFIQGGIGATYVGGNNAHAFTANFPLGLGLKYKLGNRMNIGLEWCTHFSLSDQLDGVADPYLIKSSGAFKNADSYSALQAIFTYSFKAKCRTCHNADE